MLRRMEALCPVWGLFPGIKYGFKMRLCPAFCSTRLGISFVFFQRFGSWKTFQNQKSFCSKGICASKNNMWKPNLILHQGKLPFRQQHLITRSSFCSSIMLSFSATQKVENHHLYRLTSWTRCNAYKMTVTTPKVKFKRGCTRSFIITQCTFTD